MNDMRRSKVAPRNRIFVLSISLVMLISLGSCGCVSLITSDSSFNATAANDGNESLAIVIEGFAVDDELFRVTASFTAVLKNNETGQSLSKDFKNGSFWFTVDVPDWAGLDDELYLDIRGDDGERSYGHLTFTLNETNYYVSETFRHVEVYIADPPANYNKLLVFVLIMALAGFLALWALFARWMLMKIVAKRAEDILIEDMKHEGEDR